MTITIPAEAVWFAAGAASAIVALFALAVATSRKPKQ